MSKYDIKKSPQLPSDEEINKHKNFDKVLNKAAMYDYKKATKPVYKNTKVLSIVAVLISIGLVLLFEIQDDEDINGHKTEKTDTIQKNNVVPLRDTIAKTSTVTSSSSPAHPSMRDAVSSEHVSESQQTAMVTENNSSTNVATTGITNHPANFPGGEDALHQFLTTTIKYPYNAVESPYSGKVEVDLKIEKTGEIGNVTIYHSPNAAISNEIQRVIKKMPKWEPAVKNGSTIGSIVTVEFPFTYGDH